MADGDGVINTAYTFSEGDSVTPDRLNNITDASTFTSNAITGTTLAIDSGKLKVGTITSAEMGANSVVSAAITDGAVTTAKIPDNSIITAKINAAQITTEKINDDAVTTAKVDEPTVSDMKNEADKVAVVDMLTHHPGIAKAWGVIENLDTTPSIRTGGYNVSSVSVNSGDSDYFDVTLTNAMDGTNYVVCATFQDDSSSTPQPAEAVPTSATVFTTGANWKVSGSAIQFVIYGHLA